MKNISSQKVCVIDPAASIHRECHVLSHGFPKVCPVRLRRRGAHLPTIGTGQSPAGQAMRCAMAVPLSH